MHIKYALVVLLVISSITASYACEACGCSVMFWDFGITPRFHSHQISLGWQRQSFTSFASHSDLSTGSIGSQERFQQLDLQTQWRLHSRWRLNVAVPYSVLKREVAEESWQLSGWADPSVLLQYTVIDQDQAATTAWRHRLSVGLGAKLPLGQVKKLPESATAQANFRLGTGSTDWLTYAQYVLRHGQWGLTVDGLFSRNGENDEDYRYGHRASGHLNFFGVFAAGKMGLMPSGGLYHEHAQADVQRAYYRQHTGGNYTFGQVAMRLFWPSLSATVRYQTPLQQEWSDGLTHANDRWALQLTYFL